MRILYVILWWWFFIALGLCFLLPLSAFLQWLLGDDADEKNRNAKR